MCVRVRARVRYEASGDCWRLGLWAAVIIRGQALPLLLVVVVVVVVSVCLKVVVTCTGGISILLVWQEWPPRPEARERP